MKDSQKGKGMFEDVEEAAGYLRPSALQLWYFMVSQTSNGVKTLASLEMHNACQCDSVDAKLFSVSSTQGFKGLR